MRLRKPTTIHDSPFPPPTKRHDSTRVRAYGRESAPVRPVIAGNTVI
ncbi:hypothetical protein [Kribbella soli]|nr:hypothetical protein [Kribbella soli]